MQRIVLATVLKSRVSHTLYYSYLHRDCYVAVTGLPEPLDTHAPTMCEFARECFTHFNILVRQLEVLLGPDTGGE